AHTPRVVLLAVLLSRSLLSFFSLLRRPPPGSPLFPYTTLFRSQACVGGYSSAPVVAAIYHPAMASVGLLLAVLGNVIGTYAGLRSEEHTSELQSRFDLVCRLLLEKKKKSLSSQSAYVTYSHASR